jgi:hypothetical protein
MKKSLVPLIICLLSLILGACVSHGVIESDRNQFVTEFYAEVEDIQNIRFHSDAPEAAVSWGLWGAMQNAHGDGDDMLGGALVGALFGGLMTAVAQGPRNGYEYHLLAVGGDYLVVVLDNYPADVGQCVKVRMASEVSLHATDPHMCENDMDFYDD